MPSIHCLISHLHKKLGEGGTYVLNDMTVIADEEVSPSFRHIDLHPNEPISVTWQMVQGNALAEVECLIVERFPVPPLSADLYNIDWE